MRDQGRLLEWAQVHDRHYGTPRANVERAVRMRRIMLFNLDVQGAAALRRELPDAVSIFLLPPSLPELMRRLRKRHSEGRDEMQRRLQTARIELGRAAEYDYLVTNDDLRTCVDDCEAVIRAELLRRHRRMMPGTAPGNLG